MLLQSANQLHTHVVHFSVFFDRRWVVLKRWQLRFHRQRLFVLFKNTLRLGEDELDFVSAGKFRCFCLFLLSHSAASKNEQTENHHPFVHARHNTLRARWYARRRVSRSMLHKERPPKYDNWRNRRLHSLGIGGVRFTRLIGV